MITTDSRPTENQLNNGIKPFVSKQYNEDNTNPVHKLCMESFKIVAVEKDFMFKHLYRIIETVL